ncbi:MAG: alpha-galactosidase [Bacteroidaceae bacterium]|nr:alpha-galactosidase [Bacteroidaceae bacterium]
MRKLFLLLLALPLAAHAQRTPTMGWSSWNTFGLNINEQVICSQADAMHSSGLQDAGYKYINIDDGYFFGRDSVGRLRMHPQKFPRGLTPIVEHIHKLGLKAGIYSDAGQNTCGSINNPDRSGAGVGFYGHDQQDADFFFKEHDFDFIKVDYCGGESWGNEWKMKMDERERYSAITHALKNTGHKDIVFNICRWAFPGTWGAELADSWRTTGDIFDAWRSVRDILAENLYLSAYCHDGHYNDMDMLEVGRSMSLTEDETHFGMWCIMSSPLLIGCDMTKLRPETLRLLTNKDLIALNQDRLHLQAYLAERQSQCFIMVKDINRLNGRERAVAIYNPSDSAQVVNLRFKTIDLSGSVNLFDCISQKDFGTYNEEVQMTVPAHGSKIFRAKGESRIERSVYEAECAYLPAYQELRNNQTEPSAIFTADELAHGGYKVCWLGKDKRNSLEWRNVYVQKTGKYYLTLTYFCAEDRDFAIDINDRFIGNFTTHSRNWKKPATIKIPVLLRQGNNLIRLFNSTDWMPDIDRMELIVAS